jgi:bifunctional non-homologous end joining protein LigD
VLAYKDGPQVRLMSRNGVEHTRRFPELADAVAALPGRTLVLDGEVAIFDLNPCLSRPGQLLPSLHPGITH